MTVPLPSSSQLCARGSCAHSFAAHQLGASMCQVVDCACWEFRISPAPADKAAAKPPIVVLCGSTRFRHEFELTEQNLTLAGEVVLTCGVWDQVWFPGAGRRLLTETEKAQLDELHKRKIDMADYVYVIDVGCYVGDSTRSEIAYAEAHGKEIRYWSERHGSAPHVTDAEPLAGDHQQR